MEIAKREKALLAQLDYKDGYSLYVGIPFCPTTCSYCSFTSQPIHKWKDRVDEYLDALCKEITFVGEVSKEKKLKYGLYWWRNAYDAGTGTVGETFVTY